MEKLGNWESCKSKHSDIQALYRANTKLINCAKALVFWLTPPPRQLNRLVTSTSLNGRTLLFTVAHCDILQCRQGIIAFSCPHMTAVIGLVKKFALDSGYKKTSGFRSLQLQIRVDERSNRAEKRMLSKITVFLLTALKSLHLEDWNI